jgi:O-antigen/teichoic acid export membrane protein
MSFRKNVSWAFTGNLIYSACQWGILITLAKICSPEVVGQYSLGLAVSAPVYAFCNLQLRVIQATDVKDDFYFSDYLGLRICTTIMAIVLIIAISFFTSYEPETVFVIVLIGLAKGMESFSDITYGFLQKYERMDKIAISLAIKGTLGLIAVFLSVCITKSIVWASFFLFFSWMLLFVFYDLKNAKKLHMGMMRKPLSSPRFDVSILRKIVILAIPMGVVIMLNTFNMNIPRYLIVHFYDETTLGYYAAISYLLVSGATIVNAIGQSAVPRLAKYYVNNIKAYKLLLIKMLFIAFVVSLVGVSCAYYFGDIILRILYAEEYSKFVNVFVWIMISGGLLYCSSMMGCAITAARSFWLQFFIGCVVSGTICFSAYFLIQSYSMVGAAMALAIGFFVKLVVQLILVLHLLGKSNNQKQSLCLTQ